VPRVIGEPEDVGKQVHIPSLTTSNSHSITFPRTTKQR
jgi:hypothetical protein